jgi:hypothetical protein
MNEQEVQDELLLSMRHHHEVGVHAGRGLRIALDRQAPLMGGALGLGRWFFAHSFLLATVLTIPGGHLDRIRCGQYG